ncbi:MAG: phosphoglycerate kinase [bacterium]|nr:phosphoglycerate kinase [bacterium]
MSKLSLRDIEVKDKKVLMRVDFNVPLDGNCNITDDTRIKAALPSIKYLIEKRAKLILVSHLGRPKGNIIEKMRLTPVGIRLGELLGIKVTKLNDCVGSEVEKEVDKLKIGEVLLLENTRFHKEEEKNDANFSQSMAKLADIYVNDAFGTAHRAHASTVGVAMFVNKAACGFLMEKEIKALSKLTENPERPFTLIMGGAKLADKIPVMERLIDKIDTLLLGGGVAYTFCKAKNWTVGNSLVDESKIDVAKEIITKMRKARAELHTPLDHVIVQEISEDAQTIITERGAVPAGWIGVDIGPQAIEEYKTEIGLSKTVFWNGPVGVFEIDKFAKGTIAIAKELAKVDAYTVVGGGDSIAAVNKAGVADKISHISTGGGASLEYLAGIELPGIAALTDK